MGKDGLEKASMTPGPDGFALATFAGGSPIVTEMPNVLLTVVPDPKKRPMEAMKAMKAMKAKAMKAMKAMKKMKAMRKK